MPSEDTAGPGGKLYIVGIGPGDPAFLCERARTVLAEADTVVGYTTYTDLIRPLIAGKRIISTGMMKEVDRVSAALETALCGERCAIVSSGDAGIYAMAGLALEMCRNGDIPVRPARFGTDAPGHDEGKTGLAVEVVPGIPALAAGAALLGAPLTHDFAAISLSDLLTPWETIEKRLEAAAMADFVIVLYNPKSKRRADHLETARRIILKHRRTDTPVGVVTGAMRENQSVQITTLEHLPEATVDMQTVVIVGNGTTFTYGDFMITPRGYASKYRFDISEPTPSKCEVL